MRVLRSGSGIFLAAPAEGATCRSSSNSDGGLLREAVQIGSLLRENRMSAGRRPPTVSGRVPSWHSNRWTHAGALMQSKARPTRRKLYFGGGAFVDRRVSTQWLAPPHAMWTQAPRFRIHSGVGRELDRTENFLRRYVTVMGVDPDLVDCRGEDSFSQFPRAESRRDGAVRYRDPRCPRDAVVSFTMDRQENLFC